MATTSNDITLLERKIYSLRRDLLDVYVTYVKALDEQAEWPKLVRSARAAGLSKDSLCRELGCAWSTIVRWQGGQSAPGSFAKTGIKEKLVEMLVALQEAKPRKAKPNTADRDTVGEVRVDVSETWAAIETAGLWTEGNRILEVGNDQVVVPGAYVQKVA